MKLRLSLCLLLLATSLSAQNRVHLKSKMAQERHLPFSSGVLVGNTLYIAGVAVASDATKGPVSPEQEAKLVMDQVKQTVEQAGMAMDDIVWIQVFCTDLDNYNAFNGVYQTYFKNDFPARAFIGTNKLLFGARYEVMGIAVKSK